MKCFGGFGHFDFLFLIFDKTNSKCHYFYFFYTNPMNFFPLTLM